MRQTIVVSKSWPTRMAFGMSDPGRGGSTRCCPGTTTHDGDGARRSRARCVPDRTANRGDSRLLTDKWHMI